jgi:thioredoxin 1
MAVNLHALSPIFSILFSSISSYGHFDSAVNCTFWLVELQQWQNNRNKQTDAPHCGGKLDEPTVPLVRTLLRALGRWFCKMPVRSQPSEPSNQVNFGSDVLEATRPVLVDFYADWCGPCKAIAPVLENLTQEYDHEVDFKKVDVDANPELTGQLGVRGISTLILFKDGEPVEPVVGNVSQSTLVNAIDQQVA